MPNNYLGKNVLVSGEITEVCPMRGCWIDVKDINETVLGRKLFTSSMPDPDLLIRTSGENRLSNFLLWQIAYSEIYLTETFWPEFRERELMEAVLDYQSRERRFGKVSEQVSP